MSRPERLRVASMLRLIIVAGVLAAIVWTAIALSLYPGQWLRPASALCGAALLVCAHAVARIGFLERASWMVVITALLMTSVATAAVGFAEGVVQAGFLLAVIIAGLLLGAGPAISTAASSMACLAGLSLLENAGALPAPSFETTEAGSWWMRAIVLGFGAVLLAVSSRRTRESLALAEHSDAALRRRNEELRASRDRYEALAAHANDLVSEVDERGCFLYVNAAYRHILGFEAEELLGQHAMDRTHPESREAFTRAFERSLERRQLGPQVFRVLHKDGSSRWLESSASSYRTPEGRLRTTVIARDVTERLSAESRLLLLEEATAAVTGDDFFRTAVRSLASLLQVRMAFVTELTDATAGRLRVRALWDGGAFRDVEDYAIAGTPCAEVLSAGSVHHAEGLAKRIDRPTAWLGGEGADSYFAVRLEDSAGMALGHIGVMHDAPLDARIPRQPILRILAARSGAEIERERVEADRRALEERVLRTQKLESLGLLAGGIAHDFSNMLVGIMANAEEALMELDDDDPARGLVEDIAAASAGAADLVHQLLAYAGKGQHRVGPVDLSALVRDTARMLRRPGPGAVTVECELSARPVWIDADAIQIRQVLMNLLTNALQALPESGVVTLRTGLLNLDRSTLDAGTIVDELGEGEHAYLEVQDTGCGMDGEQLEHVFDPFYTTRSDGRGLGLSTVLGIVRGHCGALRASSEPGEGTTFRVLLPALSSHPDRAGAEPRAPSSMMKVEELRELEAPSVLG